MRTDRIYKRPPVLLKVNLSFNIYGGFCIIDITSKLIIIHYPKEKKLSKAEKLNVVSSQKINPHYFKSHYELNTNKPQLL